MAAAFFVLRKGTRPVKNGFVLAVCLGLTVSAASIPVSAQSDLLGKAKGLLGKLGGQSQGSGSGGSALSVSDIASGLRDALRVGTERVVKQVGRQDGFNSDPEIHIPLPDTLSKVQTALRTVGYSGLVDDLELRLNRAAEAAAPRAQEIFWQAITDMTLDDVQRIYKGPNDAATQYFRQRMSNPLADSMRPVVDSTLAEVGAIQTYDQMMNRYKTVPFVTDVKANLSDHVLAKALEGIFLYLAREEAAIRENPVNRTTAILQRVFGS